MGLEPEIYTFLFAFRRGNVYLKLQQTQMKKIVFLLCTAFLFCNSHAQDTTLKAYVGTYTFPEGSFVASADVTLKDTVLSISSTQGAADLMQQARDTFALVGYNGMAYFKRDANGTITGIKVQVEDVLVEGLKQGATPAATAAPAPAAPEQKTPAKGRKKKQ